MADCKDLGKMDDLSYVGKVEESSIGTQKLDWLFKQDQALQVKKKKRKKNQE